MVAKSPRGLLKPKASACGSELPQVDAPSSTPCGQWQALRNQGPELRGHVAVEEMHLPALVMGQEGTQQIELVPVALLMQPLLRILEGVEDIVKMNEHPG